MKRDSGFHCPSAAPDSGRKITVISTMAGNLITPAKILNLVNERLQELDKIIKGIDI